MTIRRSDGQPEERASGEIQTSVEELVVYDGVRFITVLDRAGGYRGFVSDRGSFVKYPDGAMEARHRIDMTGRMASGAGTYDSPYLTNGYDWTFPVEFAAAPTVQITLEVDSASPVYARAMAPSFYRRTTTGVEGIRAFALCSVNASANVYAHVTASGRWF